MRKRIKCLLMGSARPCHANPPKTVSRAEQQQAVPVKGRGAGRCVGVRKVRQAAGEWRYEKRKPWSTAALCVVKCHPTTGDCRDESQSAGTTHESAPSQREDSGRGCDDLTWLSGGEAEPVQCDD